MGRTRAKITARTGRFKQIEIGASSLTGGGFCQKLELVRHAHGGTEHQTLSTEHRTPNIELRRGFGQSRRASLICDLLDLVRPPRLRGGRGVSLESLFRSFPKSGEVTMRRHGRSLLFSVGLGLMVPAAMRAEEPRPLPPAPKDFDSRRDDIPRGKIETVEYESKTVGAKRKMVIYLPPGYSADRKLPVFYL